MPPQAKDYTKIRVNPELHVLISPWFFCECKILLFLPKWLIKFMEITVFTESDLAFSQGIEIKYNIKRNKIKNQICTNTVLQIPNYSKSIVYNDCY